MAAGRHTHMCFHTLTHAYTNTCTNVQHIVFSKVLINIKTLEPKGNLFTQKHTNTQTCDTYKLHQSESNLLCPYKLQGRGMMCR